MQEIRDLLAKKSVDSPMLDDALAAVLADAVSNRTPPDQAAATVAARVGADECTAFTSLGLDRLAEALRAAASSHPALGTPRARGAVVAIQDTLRTRVGALGIVVGWLVRAGGAGRRGETLRLGDAAHGHRSRRGVAQIRLSQDHTVAAEHAEITLDGGEFAIAPLGGPVTVEGSAVDKRCPLTDGETIGIGDGLFIFKSASAGNLSSEPSSGRGRTTAAESPARGTRAAAAAPASAPGSTAPSPPGSRPSTSPAAPTARASRRIPFPCLMPAPRRSAPAARGPRCCRGRR